MKTTKADNRQPGRGVYVRLPDETYNKILKYYFSGPSEFKNMAEYLRILVERDISKKDMQYEEILNILIEKQPDIQKIKTIMELI